MDFRALKRDPDKVKATLVENPDGSVTTKTGCTIIIPERYIERELASVANEFHSLAIFAIATPDGFYSISTAIAMMRLNPISTSKVTYADDAYLLLEFAPGSIVMLSTDLVKNEVLVYEVYNDFIDSGHIPWFLGYNDMLTLFDDSPHFTGMRLGSNRAVLPLIISTIARSSKDRRLHYRLANPLDNKDLSWIPFNSIIYGPKTTTARLMGAYFDTGLVSALTTQNDATERVEDLLRT